MGFFLSFNLVDVFLIVTALVSGVMATNRGFIREAMGLVGWVMSIFIAQWSDSFVLRLIEDSIESERLAAGLAWIIPFFLIASSWFVVANLSSPTLRHFTLGMFDRPAGFLFGLLRGVVVAVLIYIGMVVAAEGEDNLPDMIGNAALIDEIRTSAVFLASLTPNSVRDTITDGIPRTHIDSGDVEDFIPDFGGGGLLSPDSNTGAPPSGTLLPDELQETPFIYEGQ
ncbi:MAG: CvpA family protein [Proteobacteria bacterium]|nr:CvpA family protein [Pseudomonadota bacterium]